MSVASRQWVPKAVQPSARAGSCGLIRRRPLRGEPRHATIFFGHVLSGFHARGCRVHDPAASRTGMPIRECPEPQRMASAVRAAVTRDAIVGMEEPARMTERRSARCNTSEGGTRTVRKASERTASARNLLSSIGQNAPRASVFWRAPAKIPATAGQRLADARCTASTSCAPSASVEGVPVWELHCEGQRRDRDMKMLTARITCAF
jgi:hypothetical protein